VKAGFKIATLMEHQESLRSMKFTPDNRRLVTGSKDSTVRVWDVARQSELYRLEGHTDDVDALAVAENGLRAVTGSRDRTIRLWDIQKGYCLATFTADSIAGQLALSGDGRTIVFRSEGQVHCLKLMGDKKQ
jgi:WD40 repeat protein